MQQLKHTAARLAVAVLTMSAAGFGAWQASEGFTAQAIIPTKGDVPTLGHGSTRYEDGRPVQMGDTITPGRAEILARNLMRQDEKRLAASLPGVQLYPAEFDQYVDFTGQFGFGNWHGSSMRRHLLAGRHVDACHALLKYRYAAKFDCSTPGNTRCMGVWTRQLKRHAACTGAQA